MMGRARSPRYRAPSRVSASMWLLAVLWLATLCTGMPAGAASDVAENRECATCHIMWLNDFKRSDVTPLVPYDPKPRVDTGRQDVASTERMCFSCHDGFMLDSRAVWRSNQHGHPVGVKPSDKVKIPTSQGKVIFPLNDDGKLYCGTCHSAHGVDWSQEESPVFLRVKNVDSSLCFACHLDRSTGPEEGNHPVFKKIANPPAELRARGARFGRGGSVICQSCHNPHGATQKKMLVMSKENSELCGTCHADKARIRHSKHDMAVMAPQARNSKDQSVEESGPCGVCHLPHKANGPALWARDLFPGVDPMSARCLSCHNPEGLAKKKMVGAHSHPTNVDVSNAGINATPKGWTSRFPLPEGMSALQRLPLYDDKGLRTDTGGKVGCASCHDPHHWTVNETEAGQTEPDPHQIEGDGQSSFLRLPFDSSNRLCANCHVDKAAVVFSKHNPAVMNPPEPNATPDDSRDGGGRAASGTAAEQGRAVKPDVRGVCAACHQPHNAKDNFLWARDSGPIKGATAALCTSCHRAGGAAENKTVGAHSHPLDRPLKAGMQPHLPRFGASGREESASAYIDCATCHDPHQWDPANMANHAGASAIAKGDAGNSFLRLPASGRAELCVECHREQRLVRGTDHDLSVVAPQTLNAKGQTAAQSGVCGQCHSVHNAIGDLRLWARNVGAGQDADEKLCRSCHAVGQVAAAKVPADGQSRHPGKVTAWSPELRARFNPKGAGGIRVYGVDGLPAKTGVITCPSCHNPHQWNARTSTEGPGKNTEGDVDTSFLRLANTESFLCADCHGRDALFRYKYYHGKSAHKNYPLYR
jgi:predicted CXXCH cytochrome family protein